MLSQEGERRRHGHEYPREQDGHFDQEGKLYGNLLYRLPAVLTYYRPAVDIKSISPFGQVRWNPGWPWGSVGIG